MKPSSDDQPRSPEMKALRFGDQGWRLVTRLHVRIGLLLVVLLLIWQGPNWWREGCRALVRSALAEWRLEDAQKWASRSRWWEDNHEACWLDEARLQRKRGRVSEARSALDKAARLGAAKQSVSLEELLLRAQSGDLARSENELLNRLRVGDAEAAEVCDALVLGYLGTGQFLKAEVTLHIWQKDLPRDFRSFVLLGTLSTKMGRRGDAIKAFLEALRIRPHDADAAYFLGEVFLEDENPEEAFPYLRRSARHWPDRPEVQVMLARALTKTGQLEEAVALSERVVVEHSDSDAARLNFGQTLLAAGRAKEALDALRPVVERSPNNVEVRFQFGSALRLASRTDEAEPHLEFARTARLEIQSAEKRQRELMADPRNIQERLRVSEIFLRYELEQQGLIALRGVLAIDPTSRAAHQQLASYYRKKSQTQPEWAAVADQHARLAAGD